MYLCTLDSQGQVLLHGNFRNFRPGTEAFLKAVEPYRQDLSWPNASSAGAGWPICAPPVCGSL